MKILGLPAQEWLGHPTRSLLEEAQMIAKAPDVLDRQIGSRILVVTSLASAAIEAVGYALLAGALIATAGTKTLVCWVLRGTFVVTWVFIGWLTKEALVKTPIQWVQFVVLQIMLGYTNPSNWVAQWKLWGKICRGLANFAGSAARRADQIERTIDSFASWDVVARHVNRITVLSFFALSSIPLSWSPQRVIRMYRETVEPLPDIRPLYQRVGSCLQRNWGLITTLGFIAAGACAHYKVPGYEERVEAADVGSAYLWRLGSFGLQTTVVLSEKAYAPIAMVIEYFRNSPDYRLQNEAYRLYIQNVGKACPPPGIG